MENNNNISQDHTKKRSKIRLVLQLLVLVKPLTWVMIIAISAGVLGFIASISIPILGAYGLASAGGHISGITLKTAIVWAIVAGISRGALRYVEQLSNHYIAFKILALIRDRIFTALRRLAPAKLEGKQKGSLISLITSDVELLEVFYAHTISPILIAFIVSVLALIFIFSFHWILGVIALIAYLFVGLLIPFVISKRGNIDGIQQREGIASINNFILSSLRGMKEILQFNYGDTRMKQLHRKSEQLFVLNNKLTEHVCLTSDLNNFALCFFPSLMLIAGGILFKTGTINIPSLLIPLVALFSSFGPVITLSNLSNTLLLTLASGNRVLDILEEDPQVTDILNGNDVVFDNIKMENVDFEYTNNNPVLSNINLDIKKNEMLAISGKSGSGKSTILKLIMRFWDVQRGSIKMTDKDLREINTTSLRTNEALLGQTPILFNETIEENLRMVKLDASHKQIEDAAKMASVHDFILSLPKGYDTVVGELGDRLSTGEKQRICLARSFLHNSPLLMLDEPTSNIDCLNEGIILKSLRESVKDKTIVLVSHRTSSINICDKVISIDSDRMS